MTDFAKTNPEAWAIFMANAAMSWPQALAAAKEGTGTPAPTRLRDDLAAETGREDSIRTHAARIIEDTGVSESVARERAERAYAYKRGEAPPIETMTAFEAADHMRTAFDPSVITGSDRPEATLAELAEMMSPTTNSAPDMERVAIFGQIKGFEKAANAARDRSMKGSVGQPAEERAAEAQDAYDKVMAKAPARPAERS